MIPPKLKEFITIMSGMGIAFFMISSNFKGILYDEARKKVDPKYKGNKSLLPSPLGIRIAFSIPFPVSTKTKDPELKKRSMEYNRHTVAFWISVMIFWLFNSFKK